MSETPTPPSPPSGAAAAPAPFGFSDLFELSLHALVRPAASFRAAAARPAPPFAATASLALIYGASGIAINLIHTAIANPHFLGRFSQQVVLVMSGAALGAYTSLWLLGAIALYATGRLLGGRGEFDRGLEAASALTVLAPLLAVCNPLPYGCWLAPTLLLGFLAAGALEGLFGASAAPARVLSGMLAVAALAALAGARAVSDRAPEIESAALLATQAATLNSSMASALQRMPAAAANPPEPGAPPAAMPASSLDLLRAPDDVVAGGAPAAPAAGGAPTSAQAAGLQLQAQGVQQSAVGMLDALEPMLRNPALTQRMSAAQKTQFNQLNAVMKQLRGELASGTPVPQAVMNQQMSQIQQIAFALMVSQAMQKQTAAPPTPHLKPMGKDAP